MMLRNISKEKGYSQNSTKMACHTSEEDHTPTGIGSGDLRLLDLPMYMVLSMLNRERYMLQLRNMLKSVIYFGKICGL